MDFTKVIHAEVEGDANANEVRQYFMNHGIKFKEATDDYKFVGDYHIFDCVMTDDQLQDANKNTVALFYQSSSD